MGIVENKATLFKCVEAFNKCTADWVDAFYSAELVWKEAPSPSFPKGRNGGFAEFKRVAEGRLRVFPDFRMSVVKCVAEDDYVVFEQDCTGTFAVSAGNHNVGDIAKIKVVTFFKMKNGLVVEHTDFPVGMP
jgi:hypothetical protein